MGIIALGTAAYLTMGLIAITSLCTLGLVNKEELGSFILIWTIWPIMVVVFYILMILVWVFEKIMRE